jgi:NLR family CARD domain-containing protein 3
VTTPLSVSSLLYPAQVLNLGKNHITAEGGAAIAGGVASNRGLQELYLDSNQLGDRGVIALAEALRVNIHLKAMYLSGNDIGEPTHKL